MFYDLTPNMKEMNSFYARFKMREKWRKLEDAATIIVTLHSSCIEPSIILRFQTLFKGEKFD